MSQTRLVFIANPNNPTGTWLEQGALRAFLDAMPEHVIVVLDEAYLEYAREPGDEDTVGWLARVSQPGDYTDLLEGIWPGGLAGGLRDQFVRHC